MYSIDRYNITKTPPCNVYPLKPHFFIYIHVRFRYTDSTIPLLSESELYDSQPLAVFCACTAQCLSDLFGNHIVGFQTHFQAHNEAYIKSGLVSFGSIRY